jgi:hypothetical protein
MKSLASVVLIAVLTVLLGCGSENDAADAAMSNGNLVVTGENSVLDIVFQ